MKKFLTFLALACFMVAGVWAQWAPPFVAADSYEHITHWYVLNAHSNQTHYLYTNEGVITHQPNADYETTDNYAWGFVGNPDEGYTIYNKKTGSSVALDSNTPCTLSDAGVNTKWTVEESAETSEKGRAGFCIKVNGQNYVNFQRTSEPTGNLDRWGQKDAGSTFTPYEITTYTVHITSAPAGQNPTVTFKTNEPVSDGENIVAAALTKDQLTASPIEGYDASITIEGTSINVTYSIHAAGFPDAGTYYVTLKCKDEGRNPYLYNDSRENTYTLQAASLPSPVTNNYVWRVESDGTNLTIVNGDGRKIGVNGNVHKRLDAAWQFINKGDGYFYLKNADIIAGGNHECLNASNGGQKTTVGGAEVRTATTWTGDTKNDNLWKVETVEAPSVYNVEITGAENAYVIFGSEYAYDGGFFLAESISDTQLTASTVAHHDANITISGTTITLTYTPSSAPDWEGLQTALNEAGNYPVGDGLGEFSWMVLDVASNEYWELTLEYYQGLLDERTATVDDVDEAIANIYEMIAALQINMPKPNTFLRVKGAVSGNYIAGDNSISNGRAGMTDKTDASSILYYTEDGQLIGYQSGLGFTGTYSRASVGGTFEHHTFSASSYGNKGAYTIESDFANGSKVFYDGTTDINRNSAANSVNCAWYLEEVTELPVTVTSAGYATLYAPVNLTIPADVKVYTLAEGEGSALTTTQIEDIIPANTGVVLENQGSFSFTITDETANHASCIIGTCATIASTEADGNYVFSIKDGTPGFYKFVGSELKGFKAYYKPTVASINGFSLDFGGQIAGVNSVISATNLKAGYDIQGRKLNKIQKGINILNGKKIIK